MMIKQSLAKFAMRYWSPILRARINLQTNEKGDLNETSGCSLWDHSGRHHQEATHWSHAKGELFFERMEWNEDQHRNGMTWNGDEQGNGVVWDGRVTSRVREWHRMIGERMKKGIHTYWYNISSLAWGRRGMNKRMSWGRGGSKIEWHEVEGGMNKEMA